MHESTTLCRRQSKTLSTIDERGSKTVACCDRKRYQQSTNADQKPWHAAIETLSTIDECGSKSLETVLDCHLSPVLRQMAIENSVSNDFSSAFLETIGIFVCRLTGVSTCVSFSYWLVHEVISIFHKATAFNPIHAEWNFASL